MNGRIRLILVVLGLLVLAFLVMLSSQHWYVFERVGADEVGIQMRGGQIVRFVPAGIYSDVGLFVEMERYSVKAYQFVVADQEVITSDNQRLGVTVSGSVFRPGLATDADRLKLLWIKYRTIYTDDKALQDVVNNLATQAMKVCVGDRPFRDSVVGSTRDSLRSCIDTELNKLTDSYGLSISNVTVPNVTLSEEVQGLLDAITKSRLETEKAAQDELRAKAEGAAKQAEQEANIRVEQSKIQEETRQQTTLAKLNQEKLIAQQNVIRAEKDNDLLSAQKDLEINKAMAAAALEKAKADLAKEYSMAALISLNPQYAQYLAALANASAIKDTDKLMFIPQGTFPQLIFGNNSLLPLVPLGPTQTQK